MDDRLDLGTVTFSWGAGAADSCTVRAVGDWFETPGYGVITITEFEDGVVKYKFDLTEAQNLDADFDSVKAECVLHLC